MQLSKLSPEFVSGIHGADANNLSPKALERGRPQLGTLGSGNRFLKIEVVAQIFCPHTAKAFGLAKGQITLMLHCGSRGLGHQVCQDDLSAMAAAANYAWVNRQILLHQARQVFMKTLDISPRELGMNQLYNVSHNMPAWKATLSRGKPKETQGPFFIDFIILIVYCGIILR